MKYILSLNAVSDDRYLTTRVLRETVSDFGTKSSTAATTPLVSPRILDPTISSKKKSEGTPLKVSSNKTVVI